jgi:hypothetical protein
MKPVIRALLALLAGMMTAVAVIATLETLSHQVWPVDGAGVNPRDPRQLANLLQNLPLGALVSVVVAWCAGSAGGAWIGTRLAGAPHARAIGLGVGGVIWLATAANVLSVPHPLWMTVAGLVGVPLAAWWAVRLALRRSAASGAQTPPGQ